MAVSELNNGHTGDYIDFPIPAGLDVTGAFTIAGVVKRLTDTTWDGVISALTSAFAVQWAIEIRDSDELNYEVAGVSAIDATIKMLNADGWDLFACSHAAGTGNPVMSLSKNAAAFTDANPAFSQTNPTTANPGGIIRVGRYDNASGDDGAIRLATLGVWVGTALTATQMHSLLGGSYTTWATIGGGPTEQWEFTQAAWATQVPGLKGLANSSSKNGAGTIVTGDDPPASVYTLGGSASTTATGLRRFPLGV